MSQPLAATATRARAPAFRDHHTDHTHQGDRDREAARRTRLWTMIEALAYAGAFIDPSGILAVQRLRRAQEEEERNGRR
jgi:hypothetical protein